MLDICDFRTALTELGGKSRFNKYLNLYFVSHSEEPLTDGDVDEIVAALGLQNSDKIPIDRVIDLFTLE